MPVIEHTLPAGTVCYRNGMPFALAVDTLIRCHECNLREVSLVASYHASAADLGLARGDIPLKSASEKS